ncbi:MAG: hypothetical protein GVY22_05675 [Gammaproteobacteria bacterium]|jgi:hypothetical protein|nr:hypothetical protein [Gammaproteobacteria bacterium]
MHAFELGKPGFAVGAEQELIGKFFELLKIADAGQQGPALLGDLGAKPTLANSLVRAEMASVAIRRQLIR